MTHVRALVDAWVVLSAQDAFASAANASLPAFGSRQDDAFFYSWAYGSVRALWINPPFTRMADVLAKLGPDGGMAIMIAPEWTTLPQWSTLVAAFRRMQVLASGPGLLFLAEG